MMESQQPMKMAAAEALYTTESGASFSLFTIGSLNGDQELWSVRVPYLLSLISTLNPHGTVQGINNVERAYAKKYGPGDYKPHPVTYWSFRFMIGFGLLAALLPRSGLWLTGGARSRRPLVLGSRCGACRALPGHRVGWIFTEMGRQPWTVFGLLKTAQSVSPGVTASSVLISLITFTLIYGRSGHRLVADHPARQGRRPVEAERPGAPSRRPSSSTDQEKSVMNLPPSGSSSSRSCGRATSCSRASTSASASCCPSWGKDDAQRRTMINTIGPVWDGNEVWLLTAGGAMFAAFPLWYATLFSGFYLPLLLILAALIIRGVCFEFRSKVEDPRWRAAWDRALFFGSALPALLWGVAFANIVRGVPLNAAHVYTGNLLTLLNRTGCSAGWSRSACSPCTARSSWP